MNIFSKLLPRILIIMIVMMLFTLSLLYYLAYQSLPNYSKAFVSKYISSNTEIIRDENAVPHIFGESNRDIFFGLGYVHAQERLWQMNFFKRIAQGRLSELFGPKSLKLDILMKTLGLQSLAEKIYLNQSQEIKELLQSYSNGINHRINEIENNGHGRGSPELFFFSPQMSPWSPSDSLSIFKLIELLSTDKAVNEVFLTKLVLSQIENQKLEHLIDDVTNLRESLKSINSLVPLTQKVRDQYNVSFNEITGFEPNQSGFLSNTYAADSTRTASKKSILGTDPLLPLSTPSIWMLAHLSLKPSSVIGVTIPGIPIIFSGKNNNIAWASSFSSVDDQDLFYEKLNPANNLEYKTPSGFKTFQTKEKLIRIKGQPTRKIMVRKTENGVILPSYTYGLEAITPIGHEVSLSWTGFNEKDTTLASLLKVMTSTSIARLRKSIFDNNTFNLNLTLADEKTIDMVFIGQTPIRSYNNQGKGRVISLGWANQNKWLKKSTNGSIEISINPLNGILLNTNNRFFHGNYPNHLSFDWGNTQRLIRATKLINSREFHTTESFVELQNDTVSETARTLLPLLGKELWYQYQDEGEADLNKLKSEILSLLINWNGEMNSHSPEPLIYTTWIKIFQKMILEDEFGLIADEFYKIYPLFLEKVLRNYKNAGEWCDIKHSRIKETCFLLAEKSLDESLLVLKENYGPDLSSWRWGEANKIRHPSFSTQQIFIPKFLREITHEMQGGTYTLNSSSSLKSERLKQVKKASGFRMIIDFSQPDKSMFIIPTGQSGHFLSKHYDDLTNLWKQGQYITLSTEPSIILGGAKGKIIISPASIK